MAILVGIAVKEEKIKPMNKLDRAEISVEKGVENDVRGKPGKRQITILSKKVWDEVCNELNINLDWTSRRANLLIDDINLENQTDSQIYIGKVILKITGETKPCSRMDEAYYGLKEALEPNWRGGVTCRVIHGGIIAVDDHVTLQTR